MQQSPTRFPGNDPGTTSTLAFGLVAAGLIALFVGGAFVSLTLGAGGWTDPRALATDGYLRGVVFFTLEQAALSSILSLAGGGLLALALHRVRFFGRETILRLFVLPQALPVLVGAIAILGVWGRGGLLSDAAAALGLGRLDVYGMPGILIAHVFYNMPLATRIFLAGLAAVPSEHWKLAGQLSLPPSASFRLIEAPALARALPGAASLIFMLCVTSFTLVLVLGGGPGATTLEVAIYQSLRYDFDPGRAAVLGVAQIILTGIVLAGTLRLGGPAGAGFTLARPARRFDTPSRSLQVAASLVAALGTGFILLPFIAVLTDGLRADLWRLLGDRTVQHAVAISLWIAVTAAALSLGLALALLLATEQARKRAFRAGKGRRCQARLLRGLFEMSGSLVLVVPPIVLGAGWFLILRQVSDVASAAPFVVVLANAVMALPFVVRIVQPALAQSAERHDRLASSLGLFGLSRLIHVEWPAIRAPMGLGLAFALALSLGDLGVVALFGNQDLVTLPYLLLQRMGSYRSSDAAGLALILAVLTIAVMAVAERGFGEPRTMRP